MTLDSALDWLKDYRTIALIVASFGAGAVVATWASGMLTAPQRLAALEEQNLPSRVEMLEAKVTILDDVRARLSTTEQDVQRSNQKLDYLICRAPRPDPATLRFMGVSCDQPPRGVPIP